MGRPYDDRFHGKIVADVPLNWLSIALSEWIESFFDPNLHPLMPSYALDTARLVEFHAEGYFGNSPESWRLEPIVADLSDRDLFRFLSPTFKKEFTERMGHTLVIAKIPEGARLSRGEKTIASAGTTVLFAFDRCYLSESWNDYGELYLFADDPSAPEFDLMEEFCFTGSFLVNGRGGGRYFCPTAEELEANAIQTVEQFQTTEQVGCIGGMLPADWITDVVEFEHFDRSGAAKVLAVPEWEAELD
jgi:hypothetical protein